MGPVISAKELKSAQAFHGNVCLGLPLGLRAGHEALQALEVSRAKDKELVAIVEIAPEQFSHCFLDGIQWITGCTRGKNNLQLNPVGKFALTLVEISRHAAVRVSYQAAFLEEFLNWPPVAAKWKRQKDFKPEAGEIDRHINDLLTRPASEMFSITHYENYPVVSPTMDWTHERCAGCGELVLGSYTHFLGKEALCPACWGQRVHAKRAEGRD
ncbi:Formylmethanofuran dehydrogenase, subunit E domain protein [Acididesulfobacillus acetoxydans]|uniref:FmdE, Molybdenum formylmethanofuran dehydrogenase operon n=1 Tax=Acididesulfobacillus acetoxydans TaxID=1561005 RepID=A0A8S0WGW3_9FIRM|nr:FmdE family protein [Acididesulfobacillus acetoxydans]CAA7602252.1 Formylmethanofuran dehydrogenase, subunit E domain protein [Acididesulfobacillus acetoxydans]CEJ07530.1 FmdE, Molybdenum formylmethanofuran dehydrogenase operon [Acididesulfobacillus acetoxydans]